jgi:hypothetical protein
MTIEINGTSADVACESCYNEYPGTDIIRHLKNEHGYGREFLEAFALRNGIDVDVALCEHPNGFGPNGCAGCGAVLGPYDDPDVSADRSRGIVRDGVTTEIYECKSPAAHSRHLHQPVMGKSEWFTCNGRTMWGAHAKAVERALHRLSVATSTPGYLFPTPESVTAAFRFPTATDDLLRGVGKLRPVPPEEVQEDPTEAQDEAEPLVCPECGLAFLRSYILLHLREEEAVDQSVLDEFADANGLDRLWLLVADEPSPNHVADPNDVLNGEDELTEWWLQRAKEEAEAVIPKAVAYGSNSLMQLGRKVAQLQGRQVDDAEAMELGCWINAVQKIERWTDSVMRGERCSDDTIYDAGIYVKMVQRIRDVGSWPGV